MLYFNTDPEVGRCSVTVGRIADGNSAQGFTARVSCDLLSKAFGPECCNHLAAPAPLG